MRPKARATCPPGSEKRAEAGRVSHGKALKGIVIERRDAANWL